MSKVFDPMGMYSHPTDFHHEGIDVKELKELIRSDYEALGFASDDDGRYILASIETSEWLLELHAKKLAWLKKQDIVIIRAASRPQFAPVPFSSLVCSRCHSNGCRCFDVDIPFVDDVCTCSLYFSNAGGAS